MHLAPLTLTLRVQVPTNLNIYYPQQEYLIIGSFMDPRVSYRYYTLNGFFAAKTLLFLPHVGPLPPGDFHAPSGRSACSQSRHFCPSQRLIDCSIRILQETRHDTAVKTRGGFSRIHPTTIAQANHHMCVKRVRGFAAARLDGLE